MLAVIPVRDGGLANGAADVIAECHGRTLLVGTGTASAAQTCPGQLQLVEVDTFAPGAWASALAPMLAAEPAIVFPASADGRDLAPRLAAELGRAFFAAAVEVTVERITVMRDGGAVLHTFIAPESFVATLQVGSSRTAERRSESPAGTTEASVVARPLLEHGRDARFVELIEPDPATIDLAEAGRIIGGGAGLDAPQRLDDLAAIGAVIGASVGATRVVTDRGWAPHQRQIGTTGVVVDPDLYLAFGVSGAVQHTSGLGDPQHVISINTDPFCPMMQLADLAIVADANAVIAELIRLTSSDPDAGAPDA